MSESTVIVDIASDEAIQEKLVDAMVPGFQAEFDPEEAERAGAFVEDALSESEAMESDIDLSDAMGSFPLSDTAATTE